MLNSATHSLSASRGNESSQRRRQAASSGSDSGDSGTGLALLDSLQVLFNFRPWAWECVVPGLYFEQQFAIAMSLPLITGAIIAALHRLWKLRCDS